MKNSKSMKIILFIIILIILIIAAIMYALLSKKDNNEEPVNNNSTQTKSKESEDQNMKIELSKYYSISNLVNRYYGALLKTNYVDAQGNNYSDNESVKQYIYDMLSTECNNITVENIYDRVEDIEETVRFVPISIKVDEGEQVSKYLLSGDLVYMFSNKLEKKYVYVNIDNVNNTFSIEPIDNKENIDMETIQVTSNLTSIEKNTNNSYEYKEMSQEDLSKQLFSDFKLLILRKSEDLYNNFNEEYRTNKFGDYNGFCEYVDNNYDRLSTIVLEKYQVTDETGYTQYICLDEDERYYIFRDMKSSNSQEILLDTYTIDIPEFTEKYNKATEAKKAGYNVERFISAINDKDYKYAYSKLDDVFKSKNMPTQQDFENYVKNNLFEKMLIEHNSAEKQGNLIVYKITVEDESKSEDGTTKTKDMTIIMQLQDDTDFVMSFSID